MERAAACLLVLLATACAAPPGDLELRVLVQVSPEVADPGGRSEVGPPLTGATVALVVTGSEDRTPVARAITDDEGWAILPIPEVGIYDVLVDAPMEDGECRWFAQRANLVLDVTRPMRLDARPVCP